MVSLQSLPNGLKSDVKIPFPTYPELLKMYIRIKQSRKLTQINIKYRTAAGRFLSAVSKIDNKLVFPFTEKYSKKP